MTHCFTYQVGFSLLAHWLSSAVRLNSPLDSHVHKKRPANLCIHKPAGVIERANSELLPAAT